MPPDPRGSAQVLRRSGQRPLRFDGRALGRMCWPFAGRDGAITLGLYTAADGFVVEMSCRPPRASRAASWDAALAAASLEQAVILLETTAQLCVPAAAARRDAPGAFNDACLRLCLQHGLRSAFAQSVGQFLHALCAAS